MTLIDLCTIGYVVLSLAWALWLALNPIVEGETP